ncbi:MAG: type II toxin-antitoxin system YhaV family toxin [Burkholderiales bacterium]
MIKPGIPLSAHGWSLYAHPLFLDQIEALIGIVERLKAKNPNNYAQKNSSKRLAAIAKLVFDVIPEDPTRPEYRLGATLGDARKHWFRAKFYQQYRLFFRFHAAQRIIVYAWVNDDDSKRAYSSDKDAYRVFSRMLDSGRPPEDWDQLMIEAKRGVERMRRLSAGRTDLA